MPKAPTKTNLTANSAQILNAIHDSATETYRSMVPRANSEDIASIKEIGNIVMNYTALTNEFLTALYNRIARVIITSKTYYNPWEIFKKGLVEYGESIEEIFVNIATPHQFDPSVAETNFMKREIPDVRSAFHTLNYQKFYKDTISDDQLRQAFLSWEGITDLIAKIVDSMYTAANYDEYQTMKYLLARSISNGYFKPYTLPEDSATNIQGVVSTIKGVSNMLEFLGTDNNMAGVYTNTLKDDQFVIIDAKFEARMGVEVLATSFNMDKAEFMGHRILIDGFSTLDDNRLQKLFADDPYTTYTPLTEGEKTALSKVPAVIVDRNFFMIFDNFYKFTEDYNGEGLYWQYWYQVWKTFSVSPFANAVLFVDADPTVTAVTVSPSAATVTQGQGIQLSATVTGTNFPPKGVTWKSNVATTTVDANGYVSVSTGGTAGQVTITATSVYDPEKSGTAKITTVAPTK